MYYSMAGPPRHVCAGGARVARDRCSVNVRSAACGVDATSRCTKSRESPVIALRPAMIAPPRRAPWFGTSWPGHGGSDFRFVRASGDALVRERGQVRLNADALIRGHDRE